MNINEFCGDLASLPGRPQSPLVLTMLRTQLAHLRHVSPYGENKTIFYPAAHQSWDLQAVLCRTAHGRCPSNWRGDSVLNPEATTVFINEVSCQGTHFQSSPGWSYFSWRTVWVSGYERQSALRWATLLCILCIFANLGAHSLGNCGHSTSSSALCWGLKLRKLNHWGK